MCKSEKRILKRPSAFWIAQTDVFMAVADTLGYAVKGNQEVYTERAIKFIPDDLVPVVGVYKRGA